MSLATPVLRQHRVQAALIALSVGMAGLPAAAQAAAPAKAKAGVSAKAKAKAKAKSKAKAKAKNVKAKSKRSKVVTKTVKLKNVSTTNAGTGLACTPPAKSGWLIGGECHYTAVQRFHLDAGTVSEAILKVKMRSDAKKKSPTIRVLGSGGKVLDTVKLTKSKVSLDVEDGVPSGGGDFDLTIDSTSPEALRVLSTQLHLKVTTGGDASAPEEAKDGSVSAPGGSKAPKPPAAPAPAAPAPGVPAPAVPQPGAPGQAVAPTNSGSIWVSPAEIRALPMSGSAWTRVKSAADGSLGSANISDQNSNHDVNTLAAALVYVRTGDAGYRSKAASAISAAIGTEEGGRTLALGRNLTSYVIAADLIGLDSYDSSLGSRFRTWLSGVRTKSLSGLTLISTHERRPNNWGTMAGGSRIAADLYLGDTADLAKAVAVFKGYLGDRSAYTGFDFGDTSYQANPSAPVGINPAGATKNGVDIDGAIPDDMRRGCSFQIKPCFTNYAWEAMQGVVVQADLLAHNGMPAFSWSDNAILRAASYLQRLDQKYGGWWAGSDDTWQPWLINHAYSAKFPVSSGSPGKILGWPEGLYGA